MRITDNTVNTKIKNLFTMTIESKTKTTLKLITIGNNESIVAGGHYSFNCASKGEKQFFEVLN